MTRQTPIRDMATDALTGLPLLQGDWMHVESCLYKITAEKRAAALQQYRNIWQATEAQEKNPIHKQNAARRAANLWIGAQTE